MDEVREGKVMDISKGRGKNVNRGNGGAAEADEKSVKASIIYQSIADAINRSELSRMPPFPGSYRIFERKLGVRSIVTAAGDLSINLVNEDAVISSILDYGKSLGNNEYILTYSQAKEAMRTWRGLTHDPLRDVPYLRWRSDPGYCWTRAPFDLMPGDFYPTWLELLEKVSCQDSVKALYAWIGSLFFKESYRQQYVWIYGQGNNGKGCIGRFLHRLFGVGAHFLNNIPREPNQFWTSQFRDKRLIVVPDCTNLAFPASGLCKSLVGDDPVGFEEKNGGYYTGLLDCKFLFTANDLPMLSSEESDMRRAIFIEMNGKGKWQEGFESRLWTEGGAFLADCIQTYLQVCPKHGPIPVNSTELEEWTGTLEEEDQEVFAKWFALDKEAYVMPGQMAKVLASEWRRRPPRIHFLKWLRRVHGIKKTQVRLDGNVRQWRYENIKLTNFPAASADRYRGDE